MIRIRSTALPAAVTLALFAGACQDALTSPRSPATPAIGSAADTHSSAIHVYAGRRADSVANQILSAWSMNGHPEYLAKRRAGRAGLHLAAATTSAGLDPVAAPALLLDNGSGTAYKLPPSIANDHADFFFGRSGSYSIQALLNASMSFVGDYGRIDAAVTVSGSGATVPANGTIAQGSGELVDCTDVFASCGSSKFMEGSLTIDNAPSCDAYASGTVTFTAQNNDLLGGSPSYGSLSTSGSSSLPAVAVVPVSSNSSACVDPGDNGGTGTPGDGSDGPPLYPAPEPAPPIDLPPAPVEFHCETTQWWFAGNLEWEVEICYAD